MALTRTRRSLCRIGAIAATAAGSLMLAAPGGLSPSAHPAKPPFGLNTDPPPSNAVHVLVIVMENRSYSDIVGSSAAPYQTRLSRTYQTATNSYGVGHESLDNYLAILTGRFYPWSTGDCTPGPGCQSSAMTFASQLDDAHIPWDAYMGSMPIDCDHRDYDNGNIGHSYVVRHDPFVYLTRLRSDCQRIQPGSRMLGELDSSSPPDFVWYSPQICDDGGGDEACSTIAAGDEFLAHEIPAIQATRWYAKGGVIVLTYDEGNASDQGPGEHLHGPGNHILTVVVSAATQGKGDVAGYVNHFGLLGSLEKAYGLSCLAQACVRSNGVLTL